MTPTDARNFTFVCAAVNMLSCFGIDGARERLLKAGGCCTCLAATEHKVHEIKDELSFKYERVSANSIQTMNDSGTAPASVNLSPNSCGGCEGFCFPIGFVLPKIHWKMSILLDWHPRSPNLINAIARS